MHLSSHVEFERKETHISLQPRVVNTTQQSESGTLVPEFRAARYSTGSISPLRISTLACNANPHRIRSKALETTLLVGTKVKIVKGDISERGVL